MKKQRVTKRQAFILKKLGFNKHTTAYYNYDSKEIYYVCCPKNLNRFGIKIASAPTVDEAIDFLRQKYNVIIYNTSAPYVDPIDPKRRISYNMSIKYCNRRDGWIGYISGSYNIYAVKRCAISTAIKWIDKYLMPYRKKR